MYFHTVEIKNLQKKKQFEDWIESDHLLVQVNARRDDVDVPEHLKNTHSLTLKLSKNFQGELLHDEEQITAYLLFDGNYHCCIIPWGAIWGMSSCAQESRIWNEDIPKEVLIEVAKARFTEIGRKLFGKSPQTTKSPEVISEAEPKTADLQTVEPKTVDNSAKSKSKKETKKRRKPDLKVIK
jgi:stringent starvation protein B